MASPNYTEDLTDISLAQSTSSYSAYGGGGAGLGTGADFAMQGTLCVDKQITNADKGILYNNGSTAGAVGSGVHVFQWLYCATAGLTDTIANNGTSIGIGTGTSAFCKYHVEGNDTYGAAGRVARCYPIDYSVNTTNGSAPYRTRVGSPGATPSYFGGGLNTTATVKGANLGIDACRYGTGAYITAGDSGDPATFQGFNTQNDAIANRWGILTDIGGSFELQGIFAIGQNNGGTATLAYFDDADINLVLADTIHSSSSFTKIIVDHASTEVYWNNVSITALGTHNPGQFVANNASTVIEVTGGTWTGIGITTLRAGCVIDGLTWRGCDTVTANSASLANCVFDSSSSSIALDIDDLDLLDACTFNSDGTGNAIDLGNIAASDTMGWNCFESGYAAQGGTAANRTILVDVDAGQTLTINVASGASTPTYNNLGSGTVDVVSGQVTTTITVVDIDTGSVIDNVMVYLEAAAGGPLTEGDVIIDKVLTSASGIVTDTRSLASDQPITGRGRRATPAYGTLYKTSKIVGTINSGSGLALTIQMLKDE